MIAVNSNQPDQSTVKVSNLYKKLGICNNTALKPPINKEKAMNHKKTPRRQTVFLPSCPESFKNLQRFNTLKPDLPKRSSSTQRLEPVRIETLIKPIRNSTPKSRFISNWSQRKEKENDN